MSAEKIARAIEAELRRAADPERAVQERRYLKSELQHLGASVPAIRKIAMAALADHPALRHDDLVALVTALWSSPVHECRMAAVDILDLGSELLHSDDISLVERLIRESRTWALVDGLAASVAAALVERDAELGATLDRRASDDDFWVRRSALLALLLPLRRGEGDFESLRRLRRRNARGARVLCSEGDRLGPSGDSEEATRPRVRVAGASSGQASGITVRESVASEWCRGRTGA